MAHVSEYVLLRSFQGILKLLPLTVVRSLARFVGRTLLRVFGFRRSITLNNIRHAYPDLSDEARMKIAVASYESVAVTLFEFLLFPAFGENMLQSIVRITNPDVLSDAISENRGVILLTAHYGSWELFGQAAGLATKVDGRLLMKLQSNVLVAREVERWRTTFGLRTSSSSFGLRDILRTLGSGGWVVIAADQAAPKESIPIDFFGREVPTYQGPAVFALQTGAPLLLGAAHREDDGRYTITFRIIDQSGLGGTDGDAVRSLTERHVRATEEMIRQDPGQWMWMHKRWKHLDEKT